MEARSSGLGMGPKNSAQADPDALKLTSAGASRLMFLCFRFAGAGRWRILDYAQSLAITLTFGGYYYASTIIGQKIKTTQDFAALYLNKFL